MSRTASRAAASRTVGATRCFSCRSAFPRSMHVPSLLGRCSHVLLSCVCPRAALFLFSPAGCHRGARGAGAAVGHCRGRWWRWRQASLCPDRPQETQPANGRAGVPLGQEGGERGDRPLGTAEAGNGPSNRETAQGRALTQKGRKALVHVCSFGALVVVLCSILRSGDAVIVFLISSQKARS